MELEIERKIKESEKVPRRRPVYPMGAERELARAALGYVNMVIRECGPIIRSALNEYEEPEEFRQDDSGDFISHLRGKRLEAAEKLSRKTGAMKKLEKEVVRSGNMALNHSVADWGDMVGEVFHKKIDEESYKEEMRDMVDQWIHQNVSQIETIGAEHLAKVEEIIRWGYDTRQPRINIIKRLEKQLDMSRSRARFLALDQMGTLDSRMTRYEHESAGIGKYRWWTRRDRRVRPCHKEYHNGIFKWTEPPADWYMTKKGIVYTGNNYHPGEAPGCRCKAKPVFDLEESVRLLRRHFRGE